MFALNASATGKVNTPEVQIRAVDSQIKTITLASTGVLQVEKTDGTLLSQTLSTQNAQELLFLAQDLSAAELVTDHHPIICMMALNPLTAQDLYVLSQGELKLTLSTSSCAVSTYTHPKEDYELAYAQDIKAELIVLARQLTND